MTMMQFLGVFLNLVVYGKMCHSIPYKWAYLTVTNTHTVQNIC